MALRGAVVSSSARAVEPIFSSDRHPVEGRVLEAVVMVFSWGKWRVQSASSADQPVFVRHGQRHWWSLIPAGVGCKDTRLTTEATVANQPTGAGGHRISTISQRLLSSGRISTAVLRTRVRSLGRCCSCSKMVSQVVSRATNLDTRASLRRNSLERPRGKRLLNAIHNASLSVGESSE